MAYREEDRVLVLERELARAEAEIASLKVDNEVLRAQLAGGVARPKNKAVASVTVGVFAGIVLACVTWLATSNDGLAIFALVLPVLGGALFGLLRDIPAGSGPAGRTGRFF